MLKPDVIKDLQDLRYLSWTRARESSGTAGSYLKSYEERDRRKIYYKLSCFDSVRGITGHESINELIADRLLSILGIDHLSYQLLHGTVRIDGKEYETWLCASENFREPGESKLALDDYYDLHKAVNESPLEFCSRCGWDRYIFEMLIVDFLILNRDRHGANIEVLLSRGTDQVRLAPLFDHGLSLLYSCDDEDTLRNFDITADRPVQCFVGSRSAAENLTLVLPEVFRSLRRLEERDRVLIFRDLDDCLTSEHMDKIWDMIMWRWEYCENLFNTK